MDTGLTIIAQLQEKVTAQQQVITEKNARLRTYGNRMVIPS
jgi:hypothetical protein